MSEMVRTSTALEEEISSFSEEVPAHSPSAPSTPDGASNSSGVVEGAWHVFNLGTINDDWTTEGYSFVPQGSVETMPEGTAAYVLDGYRHWLCEFPQSGQLRGPLIWRPCKPRSEDSLLERGKEWDDLSPAKKRRGTWVSAYSVSAIIPALGLEAAVSGGQLHHWVGWAATTALLFTAVGALNLWRYKKYPLTIASVNQRISIEVGMAHGLLSQMQGSRTSRQNEVGLESPHRLEAEVASLQGYQAQRQRLTSIGMPRNSMVDHTASMLDDLYQRLQAVPHQADLRQTFLSLVERAEAEVVRLIERKEAREIKALEGDMKALIMQIERHPA